MAGYYTESNYENAVLQLLNEGLGYTYVYGPDVERDYHSPLYEDVLLPALQRINKGLPLDAIGNKAHKEDMARKFKDNDSPLKIAIVVDMWLTGFDVPSLATMYVYKPMAGHNLMQAIARVNRVFKDKEGGLVVDYVGIAAALKQAMNDYTAAGQEEHTVTRMSAKLPTRSSLRNCPCAVTYSMVITTISS